MGKEILSILCPTCAAPSEYDIVKGDYHCAHCGNKIILSEVLEARKQHQLNQKIRLKQHVKDYSLLKTTCKGCGASLVFNEGEVISRCKFCSSSVVRSKYIYDESFPENIIPFVLTIEEAKANLKDWCKANSSKKEAKELLKSIDEVEGYYLPYEMFSGPVTCEVRRLDDVNRYKAKGYVENGFINCSNQLDNLVLDAMEPYDLSKLDEFNFGYVAGCHVKISDINKTEEDKRINLEINENYREKMNTIYNSKAIDLQTEFRKDIRVPVLLPVYYISNDKVHAAINGQTGKIAVKARKDSFYITMPWWIKSIAIFIAYSLLSYLLVYLACKDKEISMYAGLGLFLFEMFLFLFMIRDSYYHTGTITRYRKIFTNGDKVYKRENGTLIESNDILKEKIEEPLFERNLNKNKTENVYYRFAPPIRMVSMILASFLVVLWPIILALLVNGFDFNRLYIKGSAIWLLITLPTVPVHLVRGAVQWLYDSPWIYDKKEDGKLHRRSSYEKFKNMSSKEKKEMFKTILMFIFLPPACLLTWAVIAIIAATVYFTAFGI